MKKQEVGRWLFRVTLPGAAGPAVPLLQSERGCGLCLSRAHSADDQINQSFGYKQELRRALKLFSLCGVVLDHLDHDWHLLNYAAAIGALGPASIWL